MQVVRFPPSAALAPFVRCYEVLSTNVAVTRMLVPDTCLILGFRQRGGSSDRNNVLPRQVLTGVRDTVRVMATQANSSIVLAKFHEGGAAAFFDLPLHDLFGVATGLDDLIPRAAFADTADIIAEAADPRRQVAALEAFLLARRRERSVDMLVTTTIDVMRTGSTPVRVSDLAARVGLSVDALEKRFRRVVGASPKQIASIARLRSAITSHTPQQSLTQLALNAGYYDQAHFNRHFTAATGVTPGVFFSATEYCA